MWEINFLGDSNKSPEAPAFGTVCHSLCSLPANDGNFGSAIKRATDRDIEDAIRYLTANPKNNGQRLKACQRELRRRQLEN